MSTAPMVTQAHSERAELVISNVLRTGVICSLILIAIGLTITFIQHRDWMSNPTGVPQLIAVDRADVPSHWSDVTSGIARHDGQAVVMLGLLVLISTPVIRVALSIVVFALQHDRIFVAITALVLFLLLVSFFLGKAEA